MTVKMPKITKQEEITPRRLSNIIEKVKNFLIEKEASSGLYENFGQTEVSLLRSSFIDISSYSEETNRKRDLINSFDNWCMSYQGSGTNS